MKRVEPTIEEKIRALPDLMELEGAEGLLVAENRMTPRLRSIIELRKRELKQALVVLLSVLLLSPGPVASHSWYSQACCSGKDCAPIPASGLTETTGGWIITLQPGDHPMVTTHTVNEFIPFSKGRTSEDGDYHACVRAEAPSQVTPPERIICLYVPNPGGTS
jgi:hypothetical protein